MRIKVRYPKLQQPEKFRLPVYTEIHCFRILRIQGIREVSLIDGEDKGSTVKCIVPKEIGVLPIHEIVVTKRPIVFT